MKRRVTEVEIEQVVVLRIPAGARCVWCPECVAQVAVVTPEEAARIAGVTTRAIYRQIEARALHFTEMPGGALLICLNSVVG